MQSETWRVSVYAIKEIKIEWFIQFVKLGNCQKKVIDILHFERLPFGKTLVADLDRQHGFYHGITDVYIRN